MRIKKVLVLGVMLCLLALTYIRSASADAGGACLGQWSECTIGCNKWHSIDRGIEAMCVGDCNYQLNRCLQPLND